MKDVTAFAPYYRRPVHINISKKGEKKGKRTEGTVITRHLTRRTTPFIGYATDPTDVAFVVLVVVPGIPVPLGDGAPVFDVDFHIIRWGYSMSGR